MTTFDDRERAFENLFQHDQELLFKIQARRDKLAGLWAAEHLGLSGADADAYARDLVASDVDKPGVRNMIERIRADFTRKGVDISEHRIEKELEHLRDVAREQISAG